MRPGMLWMSCCVIVVLAVVLIGLPAWLAVPAVLAMILLSVRTFVSRRKARRWLLLLAVGLAIWIAVLTRVLGMPHVSVSSRSPDGTIVADMHETVSFVDRRFTVRLTKYWLRIIPIRRVVYVSPDEGPPGGERLLWSRDGRHLLLLGPNLVGTDTACLSSGDILYLLVDTRTGLTASNARQIERYPRFSVHDVSAKQFDVDLTPGTRDRLNRCVPQLR